MARSAGSTGWIECWNWRHLSSASDLELPSRPFATIAASIVPEDKVYPVLEFLLRERGFDMLVELTAVDYLEYPEATDRLWCRCMG